MSGLPWVVLWRRRRDLNPHGFPHDPLKQAHTLQGLNVTIISATYKPNNTPFISVFIGNIPRL